MRGGWLSGNPLVERARQGDDYRLPKLMQHTSRSARTSPVRRRATMARAQPRRALVEPSGRALPCTRHLVASRRVNYVATSPSAVQRVPPRVC